MNRLNFPQSVVCMAMDKLFFESAKPFPFEELKKSLIEFDEEIAEFANKDIRIAIKAWEESRHDKK